MFEGISQSVLDLGFVFFAVFFGEASFAEEYRKKNYIKENMHAVCIKRRKIFP